jgi:hypothetical protein
MKHDIFEFKFVGMTRTERLARIVLWVCLIGAICLDLFLWRPL